MKDDPVQSSATREEMLEALYALNRRLEQEVNIYGKKKNPRTMLRRIARDLLAIDGKIYTDPVYPETYTSGVHPTFEKARKELIDFLKDKNGVIIQGSYVYVNSMYRTHRYKIVKEEVSEAISIDNIKIGYKARLAFLDKCKRDEEPFIRYYLTEAKKVLGIKDDEDGK